ncbi:glutamine--tRNA ligase/YqeY domain fusion protein [Haliangium ochraceum]|uniref:Glutamine--tRNA ligase n=1 Tax=Haliangium ochraceum (strain DSM 14365 / JCM 11303 / SMP-2) TaxID=502025 RepID=D0LSY5_HALO1|nr:glutamine--tRNA ligase/YqeY domain fusion protein [Haliangium ochraceum]ACY19121.1 glutaminyl-tRNA synthetase [Haliangium ochraceum DSM 14365]
MSTSKPENPTDPTSSKRAAAETRSDDGPSNFVRERIAGDVEQGRHQGRVHTRFPPEPNGYLHIGHAKAICLDFGMAEEFGGLCNLRMDDTNPIAEDTEYVEAIQDDVRWLGFEWQERLFYTSDYFDQLYAFALELVRAGKAYVDSLSTDEIREYRGNYYKAGKPSPYRDRSVEENLDLLERMKNGEFEDGACVLRAKIEVNSTNINLRDPPIYRIRKASHHRTGDAWCIYPMYDYAHALSDAIEGITHSLCTLEFEDHRPLYDWCVENVSVPHAPEQIEFARLNLSYTMLSKRRLLQLVREGYVDGWDDPRMPTLRGMRRRGYTPEAIRRFCDRIGVAKRDGVVDVALLEHALRDHLNATSPRVMGVLAPLRVVIENFPEGEVEWFDAPYHPEDESYGSRKVPFSRVLYVERDDFREDAPRKWHRLSPGREVRLRYACLLTCNEVIKDDSGEVVELRCTWDPESRGGTSPDGRKVRGTLHWVSAEHARDAEVRLYDRLFTKENPLDVEDGQSPLDFLNPDALSVLEHCKVEPALAEAEVGYRCQFERLGYFCLDRDSNDERLVFNRTIGLRDSWAKLEKKLGR